MFAFYSRRFALFADRFLVFTSRFHSSLSSAPKLIGKPEIRVIRGLIFFKFVAAVE